MPAEWEPHEATWLAWPHEKSDWPGKFAPIPWLYGEIVRHLARVERVRILVQDRDSEEGARKILKKCHAELAAVEFFHHPTNRSWTRDYCPLFVRSGGEIAATHWRFNGWAKYDNCKHDARTPAFISRKLKMQRMETGLVLAAEPWVSGLLVRPRLWQLLSRSNGAVMTVYLWHFVPVVIISVAFYTTGVMPQPVSRTATQT